MKNTKQSDTNNLSKNCIFCKYPLLRRSLIYLGVLWSLVLVSSLLYSFFTQDTTLTFWDILNTCLFYINIPVFCYALLSFIAQRGLFNGIRYSLKKTRTFFFKQHKEQMMQEHSANSEQELNEILKEKYLYTSPYSDSTLPLLIAGGLTFFLMIVFALF